MLHHGRYGIGPAVPVLRRNSLHPMTVVTRFAPSPTGFLHLGAARTALFNWLYAKHHGGRFLLRVEDTDRKRSTAQALEAIIEGLRWLGLEWDGDWVSQYARRPRHAEAAEGLLAEGKAFRCYCTPEELAEMREKALKAGRTRLYDGRCRERHGLDAPPDITPAIRYKAPLEGETVIDDLVQGEVTVANETLDDMVLSRGDGTPTYMLAVVVDDHDMGITHVIRGDDHLTNAFRQYQLYLALGWEAPTFAHIPLIHGADGAKLSKRHGALGIEAYRDAGSLPEALVNYLLRLGWSHGDDEVIDLQQAVAWFDLDTVGRSAARFDAAKLENLNGHYLRAADDRRLVDLVMPRIAGPHAATAEARLEHGMQGLKERAKNITELSENAMFYVNIRPLPMADKVIAVVDDEARRHLAELSKCLGDAGAWTAGTLEKLVRRYSDEERVKLGKIAQPLRAALTGATVSPGIFEIMEVLGKEETLGRLDDAIQGAPKTH